MVALLLRSWVLGSREQGAGSREQGARSGPWENLMYLIRMINAIVIIEVVYYNLLRLLMGVSLLKYN